MSKNLHAKGTGGPQLTWEIRTTCIIQIKHGDHEWFWLDHTFCTKFTKLHSISIPSKHERNAPTAGVPQQLLDRSSLWMDHTIKINQEWEEMRGVQAILDSFINMNYCALFFGGAKHSRWTISHMITSGWIMKLQQMSRLFLRVAHLTFPPT